MPVWKAKRMCPPSEFVMWKKWFEVKWKTNDSQSYEFGLLRQTIAGIFGAPKDIEHYMLSSILKKVTIEEHNMSLAEQFKSARRAAKGI